MLKEEDKDQASRATWKTYNRSASWTERPPRKTGSKPQWNSKARACLPPLQPLSIIRPSGDEWPRAGSDDLGIWPNPPTPGARSGSVTLGGNLTTLDQAPREFEFRKDKLAFFNKECSRILDHVYLGSDAIAKNREILRQNGITHVLNCVGFVCPEYFKNELVYKTLWLQDNPSEDITSILYDVFDYFEDVREQNGRVLVHCCQGVSRSTSLVIAYLMWKEGQSFDDAFQLVKAARGVTNPNVGFACQLLQCQKRVHALPASPSSLLRMYRMSPHSPYDPLHLVPKILSDPGGDKLDSRGAFIIHIPTALYVWNGKHCSPMMSENATAAASQIIRYESAKGPILTVKEGEETSEFWDALSCRKSLLDNCHEKPTEKKSLSADTVPAVTHPCPGQRKVDEYNVDFEIFHRALAGGVVPPFPLSEAGSETCLPARENGWNRLKKKFANGIIKEFITSSKFKSEESMSTCGKIEDIVAPVDVSMCAGSECDSPDSFASYVTSSPVWTETNIKEAELSDPLYETSLSRSPSFSLVESFSSLLLTKPTKSSSTSPSISPSTSDYSSSFTFSPSSSNWSDLSFVSAQPSPYALESRDNDSYKSGPTEESLGSVEDSTCLLDNATSPRQREAMSTGRSLSAKGLNSTNRNASPSLAERRGSNIPSRMVLPSIDETSQNPDKLTRHTEDDVMRDSECGNSSCEVSLGKGLLSDANSYVGDDVDEVLSGSRDDRKYEKLHLRSDDITNEVEEVNNVVVYQWPSMHKMDMHREILDSRSVYMIFTRTGNFDAKDADVLYLWIGGNVSSKGSDGQFIWNEGKCEIAFLETVGRNLLAERGFGTDARVEIVKEGEEPKQLLEHLACFSLGKDLDVGYK